jgi:low affinity Fe/Cu permease
VRGHTQQVDRSTRATRFIGNVTGMLGSFPAILVSVLLICAWIVGAAFVRKGFENQLYQLLINTGTTIITFLMVFIIQNTQNRDGRAIQTKLDAQNEALRMIAKHLELDEECMPLLTRLVGVEDAPEREIRAEQEAVRDVARNLAEDSGERTAISL